MRRDVRNLINATALFLLTSAWKVFGLTVAEAMLCVQVVVATDCGGVKEIVGDADFLVEVKSCNNVLLVASLEDVINFHLDKKISLETHARQCVIDRYSF